MKVVKVLKKGVNCQVFGFVLKGLTDLFVIFFEGSLALTIFFVLALTGRLHQFLVKRAQVVFLFFFLWEEDVRELEHFNAIVLIHDWWFVVSVGAA